MLKLYPSDPLYSELDFLLTVRAALMNPACHFDVAQWPEAERQAMASELDTDLEIMFEELVR